MIGCCISWEHYLWNDWYLWSAQWDISDQLSGTSLISSVGHLWSAQWDISDQLSGTSLISSVGHLWSAQWDIWSAQWDISDQLSGTSLISSVGHLWSAQWDISLISSVDPIYKVTIWDLPWPTLIQAVSKLCYIFLDFERYSGNKLGGD